VRRIVATLLMAAIFRRFSNFAILKAIGFEGLAPSADPALDGKLNLVASAWFTILASSLSWIMPGINALIARRTRPDLVKDAPWVLGDEIGRASCRERVSVRV
jgi:hypothetical protein